MDPCLSQGYSCEMKYKQPNPGFELIPFHIMVTITLRILPLFFKFKHSKCIALIKCTIVTELVTHTHTHTHTYIYIYFILFSYLFYNSDSVKKTQIIQLSNKKYYAN